MKKGVIFDLDGTLLYTLGDISFYINQTLKNNGYDQVEERLVMQYIGNGSRNLVKRCLPQMKDEKIIDKVLSEYNQAYTSSSSPRTKLYDGIEELVYSLKEKGYKLAILTNKPQQTTDVIVEKYFKPNTFDVVIGQRDGLKIKPDKQATLNILSKFDLEPQNVFFVGDGETDVQTAINSNTVGISVLWGYRTRSQLVQAGAKLFVSTPEELLSIIS